jgi:serine/threonine protein kinase
MGFRTRKDRSKRKARKARGGTVRGRGKFGCVVQPIAACDPPIDLPPGEWVGKLVPISTRQTPSPNRMMRNAYPILGNPEFQKYQDQFETEFQKAEEIRRRVPQASELFLLPEYQCTVPIHEECNDLEAPFTQYFLRPAEGDLIQLFQHPPVQSTELFAGLIGVAKSIKTLHAQKIVHRDVKPANVLWGMERGRFWCKLADFGVAVFFPLLPQPQQLPQAQGLPYPQSQPFGRSVSNSSASISKPVPLMRSTSAFAAIPKLSLAGLRKNDPLVSERPPLPMTARDFAELEQLDWAGMLETLQYFFSYVGILERPDITDFLQRYRKVVSADAFLEDLGSIATTLL